MAQTLSASSSRHIRSPKSRCKLPGKRLPCTPPPASLRTCAPIALLYSGVGLDVLGKGFDQFPSELRDEIVARYPRKNFKESFLRAYFEGFAHKPGTTYGTVNAGVCERFIPGYKSPTPATRCWHLPFRIPISKADCKRVVTLQAEEVSIIL